MILLLQLILYCLLFTAMVRYSVRGGAVNGLYFYPQAVQERAFEIGLTDRETVKKQRKQFMTLFYIVMLTALVLIILLWNHISDFKTACLQALLFLEVVNYPRLRSLRSLRSGGLSLSGSENDFLKSPTFLECHKAN